jgi:CRP/FNR family transcriptional regulator, cyclic AMP receptor protein
MSDAASQDATVQILRSTALFAGLDEDVLRDLSRVCTRRTYGRGQYLWYQGDDGDRLVIVASGLVKVVLSSAQGDEIVLVALGRHETVGELALLDGAPRSAAVIAVEPTTVLMLSRATLLALMGRHPAVLEEVMRSLGRLVRRLTEQAGDLIFLDLGGRLAKLLLRLAGIPTPADGPVVLDLGLSQSDFAAMVGASRQAVNRGLQLLAARGLISVDGRVIILHDLPGLRRRAGY